MDLSSLMVVPLKKVPMPSISLPSQFLHILFSLHVAKPWVKTNWVKNIKLVRKYPQKHPKYLLYSGSDIKILI